MSQRSVNLECNLWSANFSQRTNGRICFVCFFTLHKPNSSVRFLGESTARQSAFQFYLTFSFQPYFALFSFFWYSYFIKWVFRQKKGFLQYSLILCPMTKNLICPQIRLKKTLCYCMYAMYHTLHLNKTLTSVQ